MSGADNLKLNISYSSDNNSLITNITLNQGMNINRIDIQEAGGFKLHLYATAATQFSIPFFMVCKQMPTLNTLACVSNDFASASDILFKFNFYNSAGSQLNKVFFPKVDFMQANDLTSWTNDVSDPFDTFTSDENVITSAINSSEGITQEANSNDLGAVVQGDVFYVCAILKHNSDALPYLRLYKADESAALASAIQLADGINQLSFVSNAAYATSMIKVYVTDETDFSLALFCVKCDFNFATGARWPLYAYINMQSNYASFDIALFKKESVSSYDVEDRESKLYNGTIERKCRKKTKTLEWLNNKGGYDHYRFFLQTDKRQYDIEKYKDSEDLVKVFDSEKEHKYTLFTEYIEHNIANWLSEIISSKDVYDITLAERKDVSVITNTMNTFNRGQLTQLTFQIQYTDEY
jgi:hypothetical protein